MPLLVVILPSAPPIGGFAGEPGAGTPNADDRTPVEHVTKKRRFDPQGLATIRYAPSDQENPFVANLDAKETKAGGLSGDNVNLRQ